MRRPVLLLSLLAFVPRVALADPSILTAIPPGEDKIVSVSAGAPAPFGGQLFDPPTALRWANWLEQCQLRLVYDLEEQKKLASADVVYFNRKLSLQEQQYALVTEALRAKLAQAEEEAKNPPWYKTPVFGAVLGAVGVVLVLGGTAIVVNAVK